MKAIILLCLLAVPALAQPPPAPTSPVPLPQWFVDIDTDRKGEVSRDDFLKHRMKLVDELDANKDGKLSLEEFLKIAEPPFSADTPGGPTLEERRGRARSAFQSFDINGSGFIERAEAEAPIQAEFNTYDTDRDDKITEPEVRLIMQRLLQRQQAELQQAEAERRKGSWRSTTSSTCRCGDADKLDKNNDGKISQQEYLSLAGPACTDRRPRACCPSTSASSSYCSSSRRSTPTRMASSSRAGADGLRGQGIPRIRSQQGRLPRPGGNQEVPGRRSRRGHATSSSSSCRRRPGPRRLRLPAYRNARDERALGGRREAWDRARARMKPSWVSRRATRFSGL